MVGFGRVIRITSFGLAAELERGKAMELSSKKPFINQLIEQNDKAFQIAVEDSNLGAKRCIKDWLCQTDPGGLSEQKCRTGKETTSNGRFLRLYHHGWLRTASTG